MAKIDEIREFIVTLRTYLTIITAIILAVGAGVSKLYLSENTTLLFWIGIIFILFFVIVFAMISRAIHKETRKLKDL